MDWIPTLVPYRQTGYFSRIITDYLNKAEPLSPFYTHPSPPKAFRLPWKPGNPSPSTGKCWSGLWKINIRTSLQRRWSHKNILRLGEEKTFTVCTAISRPFSPAISILFIRSCTPSGWPFPCGPVSTIPVRARLLYGSEDATWTTGPYLSWQ